MLLNYRRARDRFRAERRALPLRANATGGIGVGLMGESDPVKPTQVESGLPLDEMVRQLGRVTRIPSVVITQSYDKSGQAKYRIDDRESGPR